MIDYYPYLKNSLIILRQRKSLPRISLVSYVKKIILIHINFSFDFLGLDNAYFKNYFKLLNS
jgi:hypothetical protein